MTIRTTYTIRFSNDPNIMVETKNRESAYIKIEDRQVDARITEIVTDFEARKTTIKRYTYSPESGYAQVGSEQIQSFRD